MPGCLRVEVRGGGDQRAERRVEMAEGVVVQSVTKRTGDFSGWRGPQSSKEKWERRRSMRALGRRKNCWLEGESM